MLAIVEIAFDFVFFCIFYHKYIFLDQIQIYTPWGNLEPFKKMIVNNHNLNLFTINQLDINLDI